MKTYIVNVHRFTREYAEVEIQASSMAEARAKAIEIENDDIPSEAWQIAHSEITKKSPPLLKQNP